MRPATVFALEAFYVVYDGPSARSSPGDDVDWRQSRRAPKGTKRVDGQDRAGQAQKTDDPGIVRVRAGVELNPIPCECHTAGHRRQE